MDLEKELGIPAWYQDGVLHIGGGFQVMNTETLKLDGIITQTINDTLSHPDRFGEVFSLQHESGKFLQQNIELELLTLDGTLLGIEFAKTRGKKPNEGKSTYLQIVKGDCYLIVQDTQFNNKEFSFKANQVKVIKMKKGDRIFIPSQMGYTIVNAQLKDLMVLKMITSKEIDVFDNHRGAAYYVIHKNSRPEFVCNPFFGQLPLEGDMEENILSSKCTVNPISLNQLTECQDICSLPNVAYILGREHIHLEGIIE